MNAESVKAKLKNIAQETGLTFQEALTYYGLERTIYRISVSEYAEHFILKGGVFLYAIFERNYARATTDVDLLARKISNSNAEIALRIIAFLYLFRSYHARNYLFSHNQPVFYALSQQNYIHISHNLKNEKNEMNPCESLFRSHQQYLFHQRQIPNLFLLTYERNKKTCQKQPQLKLI